MFSKKWLQYSLLLFLLPVTIPALYAQQEVVLGAHSKKGNSNAAVVKGEGIGAKMDAGKKKVRLKALEVNLINGHPDSVKLYVRLFPIEGKALKENIVPDRVYSLPLKDNQINIDLSDLNLTVSGDFVIGLEWAESATGVFRQLSFHSGFFKSGVYYKERDESRWKKIPLFGLDMVVHGVIDEPAG